MDDEPEKVIDVQAKIKGKLADRWQARLKILEERFGKAPSEADEVRRAVAAYLDDCESRGE